MMHGRHLWDCERIFFQPLKDCSLLLVKYVAHLNCIATRMYALGVDRSSSDVCMISANTNFSTGTIGHKSIGERLFCIRGIFIINSHAMQFDVEQKEARNDRNSVVLFSPKYLSTVMWPKWIILFNSISLWHGFEMYSLLKMRKWVTGHERLYVVNWVNVNCSEINFHMFKKRLQEGFPDKLNTTKSRIVHLHVPAFMVKVRNENR